MATKNLAIREGVYRKLADAKNSGESFSDVIERILEKRASLLSLSGVLAESEGLTEIEKEARRIRGTARVRT
jgi:predicted CopG family antitoxin